MQDLIDGLESLEPTGAMRRRFRPIEWKNIKKAIDCVRSGMYDEGDVEILEMYQLWNEQNHCIDEDAVNDLYMENT